MALVPKNQFLREAIGMVGAARIATDDPERYRRIERSFKLMPPYRSVTEIRGLWHGQRAVIVGGGNSLWEPEVWNQFLEVVAIGGAKIIAVQQVAEKLRERGIIPHFVILGDPKDFVAGYVRPNTTSKILIASQCHDDVFDVHRSSDAYIWHASATDSYEGADGLITSKDNEFVLECAKRYKRPAISIEGGSTTGMRAWDIAILVLGFRYIDIFGFDCSSGTNGEMYPFAKPIRDPIIMNNQVYDPVNKRSLSQVHSSTESMAYQALHLELWLQARSIDVHKGLYPPFGIKVYGEGLFPDWAAVQDLHADKTRLDKLRAETEIRYMDPINGPKITADAQAFETLDLSSCIVPSLSSLNSLQLNLTPGKAL